MLGLIARADNRGLGQQTWAVYRNLRPAKTLVVNFPSVKPLTLRPGRFPDAVTVDGAPTRNDIANFLDGLTAVYTAETGYTPHLWREAETRGVRTVLHANYEFLDPADRPTVWAAPSQWHLNDFPKGTEYLPVPIETDRFPVTDKPSTAKRFLHVVGRPAIHDRNGTADLLKALPQVKSPITVTITCQQSGYIGKLMNDHHIRIPSHITLNVQSTDTENYWDNYRDQDALILPRRFGGLCLPCNEAVGAGIPAIMPNIEPNTTYLPDEWLIPATRIGEFNAKQRITYYQTNPQQLAHKIDALATDEDLYRKSCLQAEQLRTNLSWDTLKPFYEKVLCSTA
jgi:glycosyltransferase involved in cell wall biosynthesis